MKNSMNSVSSRKPNWRGGVMKISEAAKNAIERCEREMCVDWNDIDYDILEPNIQQAINEATTENDKEIERLLKGIEHISTMCGNPDPGDACRLILKKCAELKVKVGEEVT